MKIILAIHNEKGKNVLFILDNLEMFALDEAIKKVAKGEILGVEIINGKKGKYLRSSPNSLKSDNLDTLAIPQNSLKKNNVQYGDKLNKYHQLRTDFLKQKEKQQEKVVYIDGKAARTEAEILKYLKINRNFIADAAKDQKVDVNLLGAILIDEYLRKNKFDDWFDCLATLGYDSSVGLAQIKFSTAKDLIKRKFYNPKPNDSRFLPENIDKLPANELYDILYTPRHSTHFAAAKINQIISDWRPYINLSDRKEIIASLYSLGRKPHSNPTPNDRGLQISKEFYGISQKVFGNGKKYK